MMAGRQGNTADVHTDIIAYMLKCQYAHQPKVSEHILLAYLHSTKINLIQPILYTCRGFDQCLELLSPPSSTTP